MGADLLGYLVIKPKRNGDEIANDHLGKIQKILRTGDYSDKKKIAALTKLGVCTDSDELNCSEDEVLDHIDAFLHCIPDDPLRGRDSVARTIKINGIEAEIIFAGGSSWEDEPDGLGYTILKAYYYLGICQLWEDELGRPKTKRS